MFRDVPDTGINPEVMGAGSVICGGPKDSQHENYLIVANANKTAVALVDNLTYCLVSKWVNVENVNYLSSSECRELTNEVGSKLMWTFTDFFMATRGMKSACFKNADAR